MLASDQVYTKVINKVIEDAQRKENTHTVLEIDRRDTRFLTHETKNPREVRFAGDFTVRLDERWCECGKFQKLHIPCSYVVAACKHAHHEYKNYIHLVYALESVSNLYR